MRVFLIIAIAAALFAPALAHHEVFTFRDHSDYFQPLRFYTALHLRAGRLPLWNPYSASGEPWLANPQTGVFYPPTWLFLVLPFPTAYMLHLLAHLALLGGGAYLLFTRIGSRGAALAGALALMLGGPALSLLDVSNNLGTLAWVPLVLLCALEKRPILGGAALAMAFLAGEPFYASCAALMFVITTLARQKPLLAARCSLLAAATAAGLSAIQLFPFLALLRGSDRRAGLPGIEIFRDSITLRDWLHIAVPPHLPPNGFDPALAQHFIPLVYVGVVTVILAILGCTTRRAVPWLVLIAACVIIGSGPSLLAHLPLTLFRYPARMLPLASLGIAALAVLGLDCIPKRRAWVDIVVIVLLVIDLVPRARPLLHSEPLVTHRVPYPSVVGAAAKIARLEPLAHGEAWISGYSNLYERRFDALTAAPVTSARYLAAYDAAMVTGTWAQLDSMSIGWLLSRQELRPPRFEPVARARSVVAYRNQGALPMARVAGADGMLYAAMGLALDAASARTIVDTPHGGTLVLTQQDDDGWRVSLDGVAREKVLIDGIFRGVVVPAGRHEIAWRYRPRPLAAGALVTFITIIASFALGRGSVFVKR